MKVLLFFLTRTCLVPCYEKNVFDRKQICQLRLLNIQPTTKINLSGISKDGQKYLEMVKGCFQ